MAQNGPHPAQHEQLPDIGASDKCPFNRCNAWSLDHQLCDLLPSFDRCGHRSVVDDTDIQRGPRRPGQRDDKVLDQNEWNGVRISEPDLGRAYLPTGIEKTVGIVLPECPLDDGLGFPGTGACAFETVDGQNQPAVPLNSRCHQTVARRRGVTCLEAIRANPGVEQGVPVPCLMSLNVNSVSE